MASFVVDPPVEHFSSLVHTLTGEPTPNDTPSMNVANRFTATYNTPLFINPTWSSINRAQGTPIPFNITIPGLESNAKGWLTGRRPSSGMAYPRGYYNT